MCLVSNVRHYEFVFGIKALQLNYQARKSVQKWSLRGATARIQLKFKSFFKLSFGCECRAETESKHGLSSSILITQGNGLSFSVGPGKESELLVMLQCSSNDSVCAL